MDEKEKTELRAFTPIDQSLFESRNIFLNGMVNSDLALKVSRELLAMEKSDEKAPIKIWINSPGGEVYSGFAIYDMIQFIKPKVITIVSGTAASMGSVIALAAEKENRFCTINSKILLHQPLIGGTIQGSASDIEIHARDIIELKKKMFKLYAERSGTEASIFEDMMERDRWVQPEEALKLGLISKIIQDRADLP
jgi:ATP-dependent Clp protease protease subunit